MLSQGHFISHIFLNKENFFSDFFACFFPNKKEKETIALCNYTNKDIGRGLTKIWSSDSVLNSVHSTSGSRYLSFDQHLTV